MVLKSVSRQTYRQTDKHFRIYISRDRQIVDDSCYFRFPLNLDVVGSRFFARLLHKFRTKVIIVTQNLLKPIKKKKQKKNKKKNDVL